MIIDTGSIIIVKWAFTLSINASLLLTHFVYLLHRKNVVPLYLKTNISASEARILSWFPAIFQHFSLKSLGKMLPDNDANKGCREIVIFCLFSQVVTISVKRMHVLSTLKDQLSVKNEPGK